MQAVAALAPFRKKSKLPATGPLLRARRAENVPKKKGKFHRRISAKMFQGCYSKKQNSGTYFDEIIRKIFWKVQGTFKETSRKILISLEKKYREDVFGTQEGRLNRRRSAPLRCPLASSPVPLSLFKLAAACARERQRQQKQTETKKGHASDGGIYDSVQLPPKRETLLIKCVRKS